jgi:hypothetical protein
VFVSSTFTTLSLGGMAQWGIDRGRAMMDSCKAMAPSGLDGRHGERLRFDLTLRKWVGTKRWR